LAVMKRAGRLKDFAIYIRKPPTMGCV